MHKKIILCGCGSSHADKHDETCIHPPAATRHPSLLVDLLLDFGSSEPAGEGTSMLFFDKQAKRRLDSYAGPLAKFLKEHLDVYAIVSDQTVITTGHRYERVRRG